MKPKLRLKLITGLVLLSALIASFLVPAVVLAQDPLEVKVVSLEKQPTDEKVLEVLAEQGIDKNYVELIADYGHTRSSGSSYSKVYKDLKSDNYVMLVSGLPQADAFGDKINPSLFGWNGKYYSNSADNAYNNLFWFEADGMQVTAVAENDQPSGAEAGNRVIWNPRLFLDDVEQFPTSQKATLLRSSPVDNPALWDTLEWDYGICVRRIRVIEGSLYEHWVFDLNPVGEIRVEHNQTGTFPLTLGPHAVDDDTELVPASAFSVAQYPFLIGASLTLYPDPDPENLTVDGRCWVSATNETWATIQGHAGTDHQDGSTDAFMGYLEAGTTAYNGMQRGIFLFDTSGLPDDATVTATTLSIWGIGKGDNLVISPTFNIFSSAPASNDDLVAGDFNSLGTTPYATAITYAAFDTAGYNVFTFNATGRAAVSKTGVSKFGFREATYDAPNNDPLVGGDDEASYVQVKCAEQAGLTNDPKLVVTFTGGSSLTLRPNATGDEANLEFIVPDSGEDHWEDVDEAIHDEYATCVGDSRGTFYRDLYNLPTVAGSETIDSIEVFAVAIGTDTNPIVSLKLAVKTGGVVDESVAKLCTVDWALYSNEWVVNPDTTNPWTWAEINALQIGVAAKEPQSGGGSTYITQVYVEINYTPPVVPPTITTQATSSVEETTATGNGNITDTGGENCDYRGIAWDTTSRGDPGALSPAASDYANYDSEGPSSYGTGAFTRSLTSLSPGTPYYARAYAHNSAGWNWSDSEVTFYTKPNDPTALTDTDRTNNSIDISWTKGTGSENTMVRHRTDQYPTGVGDGTQSYYGSGSNTTVSTLSPAQIYYFRAWAWDENSGYSDGTSDDTAYTAPGDPSALTATTVSDTQIDLGWTKGTGGDSTMVRRKTGSYPTGPADGNQAYFDTGVAHNDTGRSPSTEYFYRAWAYDTDSGYYSDSYSQDTATTYGPPTVTTTAPTDEEETTATIGGNITATNGANASTRGVEWDTDSGTPYANEWNEIGSFGVGAYTRGLTLLTQGELYYYRAKATNTYGTGYGSEDVFLTKPIEPNTLVATPGTGEIDLTWVKGTGALNTYIRGKDGSYPANRADGYLVYNDTGASTTDTGLTGGHTYYYIAWSYATEGGEEQYSDNYDFTFGSPDRDLNLWFQPVTIISGTTMPDRSAESNTGTITWGANPSGVSISIHSLTAYDTGVSGGIVGVPPDAASELNPPEELYPDEGEMAEAGPDWLRALIVPYADITDTPITIFWWIGCGTLVLLSLALVYRHTQNLMMGGIAAGIAVGACVGMSFLPEWFILIAVAIVGGLVIMERSPRV